MPTLAQQIRRNPDILALLVLWLLLGVAGPSSARPAAWHPASPFRAGRQYLLERPSCTTLDSLRDLFLTSEAPDRLLRF